MSGPCGRAVDTAGEVCPSCFHIHPPAPVRIPAPEPLPRYRDLAAWPAGPDSDPGDVECTCGETFPDETAFGRHADEAPGYTGHWNVRNI